ncbi:glycosyltransferase family 39 protein [Candidatus Saccharibacteria bacterium TM7i]|nr:glycosyltransferase family 39 protein [Candidatus Saccharibacteria bacterium TM7i]
MKKPEDFSHYFLYRWRYVIGYSLIGVLLISLLLFAGLLTPAGLSEAEMNSAATSASLSFTNPETLAVTNLPYRLLQAGVFSVFGISTFTIKLPSLILGLISAAGFILLLRRWFTLNVAVLASLIAVTTGQFLFIAQSGTPSILYIFWPIIILLLGTQITRVKKHRFAMKAAFVAAVALSLYTPLSIYPLLAIILTIFLHPHLRAVLRRLSKKRLAIISVLALFLVAPLVYLIVKTPSLGISLIGLPGTWPPNLLENAITVFKQYFLFWEPSATTVMTPVFGLGSMLVIAMGLYRLIRTRETTRSYLVTLWILCLIPILLLNPSYTSVSFVPSMLMLAAGLTSLIGYWYRLFPRNPYARIAGLIPIVILVAVFISTGLIRYAYGYHYTPTVATLFSKDLTLLPKDTKTLYVSEKEKPFYAAVAKYRDELTIADKRPEASSFTASRAAITTPPKGYKITRVVTNSASHESDRFFVYQKSEK